MLLHRLAALALLAGLILALAPVPLLAHGAIEQANKFNALQDGGALFATDLASNGYRVGSVDRGKLTEQLFFGCWYRPAEDAPDAGVQSAARKGSGGCRPPKPAGGSRSVR